MVLFFLNTVFYISHQFTCINNIPICGYNMLLIDDRSKNIPVTRHEKMNNANLLLKIMTKISILY